MCFNFFGQTHAVVDFGTFSRKSDISPQQQLFGKKTQSLPCQRTGANTAIKRASLSGMKILYRV